MKDYHLQTIVSPFVLPCFEIKDVFTPESKTIMCEDENLLLVSTGNKINID